MSETVNRELLLFFSSVAAGVLLLLMYDVLRIFRKFVPHSAFAVSLEDLLYWFAVSFFIFGLLFERNHGALRGYAFAGILIGVWTESIFEHFLQKFCIKMLKKTAKRGKMAGSRR